VKFQKEKKESPTATVGLATTILYNIYGALICVVCNITRPYEVERPNSLD
jgi:hypothetical protein